MDIEFNSYFAIIGYAITIILGFFIGQTGIITKAFNLKFMKVESSIKKEEELIKKIFAENKELQEKVIALSAEILYIKSQNERLQSQVTLVIEYMKRIKIDDPFIDKILK
jgi:peptidoglycan hydrolase CwlO-like protein